MPTRKAPSSTVWCARRAASYTCQPMATLSAWTPSVEMKRVAQNRLQSRWRKMLGDGRAGLSMSEESLAAVRPAMATALPPGRASP